MNKRNKTSASALAFALAFALASAFAFALASAFAFALAFASAFALASAFAFAFAFNRDLEKSIKCSLYSLTLSGISFSITLGVNINFLLNWFTLIPLILVMEFYFIFFDKTKVKRLSQVFWRKLVNLFYSAITIIGTTTLYLLIRDKLDIIIKWIGYLGAGAIVLGAVIGLIYLYLKLNLWLKNR